MINLDYLMLYPNCKEFTLPPGRLWPIDPPAVQRSNLTLLNIEVMFMPLDLSSILLPGNKIKSLSVDSPCTGFVYCSQPLLPTTTASLVNLNLDRSGLRVDSLFCILAVAARLQEIKVSQVFIDEDASPQSLPWASVNLRRVSLGVYLWGHRPDSYYYWKARRRWDQARPGTAESSTAYAARVRPWFLNQLNRQHKLKELELSFNHRQFPKSSPLFDLSLDSIKGLPRLCNLRSLEKLVIRGLAHHLGRAEIEWMREYWPRLFSIEVPLIHCWLGENDAIASCRNMYRGGIPEYQEWFCQLKVVIPAECYRCDWDHYVNVVWRGDYRLGTGQHCGCQRIQDGMSGEITWDGPDALRNEAEYEDRQEWLAEENALSDEVDQYDGMYMGWHFKRRPQDHTKYARKYR